MSVHAWAYGHAVDMLRDELQGDPITLQAVASIEDHAEDLTAALHATDLDRLHLLERTARARRTITTLALALGVLWPEDGLADAVADSLADLARALDDHAEPATRDVLLRRADARADDVAVAVLIADRDARTPTEGTTDA